MTGLDPLEPRLVSGHSAIIDIRDRIGPYIDRADPVRVVFDEARLAGECGALLRAAGACHDRLQRNWRILRRHDILAARADRSAGEFCNV